MSALMADAVTLVVDGAALLTAATVAGGLVSGSITFVGRGALATIREMIDALKENTKALAVVIDRTAKVESHLNDCVRCGQPPSPSTLRGQHSAAP